MHGRSWKRISVAVGDFEFEFHFYLTFITGVCGPGRGCRRDAGIVYVLCFGWNCVHSLSIGRRRHGRSDRRKFVCCKFRAIYLALSYSSTVELCVPCNIFRSIHLKWRGWHLSPNLYLKIQQGTNVHTSTHSRCFAETTIMIPRGLKYLMGMNHLTGNVMETLIAMHGFMQWLVGPFIFNRFRQGTLVF